MGCDGGMLLGVFDSKVMIDIFVQMLGDIFSRHHGYGSTHVSTSRNSYDISMYFLAMPCVWLAKNYYCFFFSGTI